MAMPETGCKHIVLDEEGVPIIAGTTMKVIELVAEHIAWGWSPWELQYQRPYLTLGQVFSALAYYSDHAEDIESQLARQASEVERLRQELGGPPVMARLRELKQRRSA
ncbi:MAG: DUF433 domain-containing protein [Anaerolineae bacterium]|nr:DUF433 domain-containing protein [Anaerolineae bacterium]